MSTIASRLLLSLCAAALLAGCKPYRIEYHTRPAYYQRVSNRPLSERVVLDDGTVIVYNDADPFDESQDEDKKNFQIRDVDVAARNCAE